MHGTSFGGVNGPAVGYGHHSASESEHVCINRRTDHGPGIIVDNLAFCKVKGAAVVVWLSQDKELQRLERARGICWCMSSGSLLV